MPALRIGPADGYWETLPETGSAHGNAAQTSHSNIFGLTEKQAEFRPIFFSAAAMFLCHWR